MTAKYYKHCQNCVTSSSPLESKHTPICTLLFLWHKLSHTQPYKLLPDMYTLSMIQSVAYSEYRKMVGVGESISEAQYGTYCIYHVDIFLTAHSSITKKRWVKHLRMCYQVYIIVSVHQYKPLPLLAQTRVWPGSREVTACTIIHQSLEGQHLTKKMICSDLCVGVWVRVLFYN